MNVAVVGAGLMGSGIAQVFLVAGHKVTLHDSNEDSLSGAEQRIADIYSILGLESDLSGLRLESDLSRAAESTDLVIEAVTEDLAIKRQVFAEASRVAGSGAILATNTSAIPIGDIAAELDDPGRLIGTHFWNPPWAIDLVEVVQGEDTRDDVVARTMSWLKAVGMQPVHVKRDVPGCVGNRLQHALKREAIAIVEGGICDAETVDAVVKRGFGMRLATLGPLEQSDMLGLDLTLRIHETLIADLDTTPGPSQLLKKRVADGHTGMAAGKGFREWTEDSANEVRERFRSSLADYGRARIAALQSSNNSKDSKA